ncbi:MAG: Pyridoxamine 5-phosphate oxidase [Verrucomicrobiales bacterium]|nr:Pyridoxamine 5-phosphate oxidase [Verrucomicrobiales bacterium]
MNMEDMRVDYTRAGLDLDDLQNDPFDQFALWFEQACQAKIHEPNAMSLSTVSPEGRPSLRTVLLKNYDANGFVFFTNYESKKAQQIAQNPNVALLFPWLGLERQVIVSGVAEKIPASESLKYFWKRPIESQIGAWASPQSRAIESRKFLEMKFDEMKRKFADGQIPLPSFWGGFRVVPAQFEFWQGRTSRLHDRLLYSRATDGAWKIERLAP